MSKSIAHKLDEQQRTDDIKIATDVSFIQMGLSESVVAGLYNCGFHTPSPVQLTAIPIGRCGYGKETKIICKKSLFNVNLILKI